MSRRLKAILIFISGTVIISIMYYNLDSELKNIVNFFTLYGTFASLFGLWLAYIQIRSIRETSEQTKLAVDQSVIRINQVLSVSELSKASKIVQEIQSSILHSKHELALIRMKDLKQILIQIKYNPDLSEHTNNGIYNQHLINLSIDITNTNDFILLSKKGVNFSKVNQNLENLSTVLNDFENKLKFKKHDS